MCIPYVYICGFRPFRVKYLFVVPPLGGLEAAYVFQPHFPPEGGTTNRRTKRSEA